MRAPLIAFALAAVALAGAAAVGARGALPPSISAQAGADTGRVYALAEVDRAPVLANERAVAQALRRAYPSALRAAGISGTPAYTVVVSARGVPESVSLARTSGEPELDRAGAAVVRAMRFRPAQKDGRPVPVRLTLPVRFVADGS